MEIAIIILLILIVILVFISLLRKQQNNSAELLIKIASFESSLSKIESLLRDELGRNRNELSQNSRQLREEVASSLKSSQENSSSNFKDFTEQQKQKFDSVITNIADISKAIEERLERLRTTIENQLKYLQEENGKKLDEMRNVVDEKLQSTLEKRLGESFKQVSERLEQVHQGLGDMKNLAVNVGDLKKVLGNVKTRGMLGEYQLANLLDQFLSPEQYEKNFQCRKDSQARVEFAIKIPGKDEDNQQVYLPIDAKFPTDKYQNLLTAYETGEAILVEKARTELANTIKGFAKDISEKYINPPVTTDIAIMFLPTEGLFAEVVSRSNLLEEIHRKLGIIIAGPTTLGALLSSLQIGFRTFAIQKRSNEVWILLGQVKTEFGKFGGILEKAQNDISGASKKLDDLIGARTRAIERRLRNVQELPVYDGVDKISDETDEE